MDHGLMTGMLVGGVLLSSIPLALGVAIAVTVFRRVRRASAEAGTVRIGKSR